MIINKHWYLLNNNDDSDLLIDFEYIEDGDNYILTDWKGTLNGKKSTELIIPNSKKIIL